MSMSYSNLEGWVRDAIDNNSKISMATAVVASQVMSDVTLTAVEKKLRLMKIIRATLDAHKPIEALNNECIATRLKIADHPLAKYAAATPSFGNSPNIRNFIKFKGLKALFVLAASRCNSTLFAQMLDGVDSDATETALYGSYVDVKTLITNNATTAADAATITSLRATINANFNEENPVIVIPETPPAPSAPVLNPQIKTLIDGVLSGAGIKVSIDTLLTQAEKAAALEAEKRTVENEVADLTQRLAKASMISTIAMPSSNPSLGIPSGKMEMVQAETLFPMLKGMNIMVPKWTWDHAHPDVPALDDNYVFRKAMLVEFLVAMGSGENVWLHGHTGTGKTTFALQVAARLEYPVMRIAFDSSIDRAELVGRMNLKANGAGTVSEWLPGVLEYAVPNGYMLVCDEFDAGRPDAVYVMQPILEGKSMRLLEDGGREIKFHPMTRIVATGNTCGNGDPSGLYPATRILTAATLDRFSTFINVPYMTTAEETALINSVTKLTTATVNKLTKFAHEMRVAFTKGEIPISFSPRRSISFAKSISQYKTVGLSEEQAITLSLQGKLYHASPSEYQQRITELARAAFGASINPAQSVL